MEGGFATQYDQDSDEHGSSRLNHANSLAEVQVYSEATNVVWISFDRIDTSRWDHCAQSDPPFCCSMEVGMTTNSIPKASIHPASRRVSAHAAGFSGCASAV